MLSSGIEPSTESTKHFLSTFLFVLSRTRKLGTLLIIKRCKKPFEYEITDGYIMNVVDSQRYRTTVQRYASRNIPPLFHFALFLRSSQEQGRKTPVSDANSEQIRDIMQPYTRRWKDGFKSDHLVLHCCPVRLIAVPYIPRGALRTRKNSESGRDRREERTSECEWLLSVDLASGEHQQPVAKPCKLSKGMWRPATDVQMFNMCSTERYNIAIRHRCILRCRLRYVQMSAGIDSKSHNSTEYLKKFYIWILDLQFSISWLFEFFIFYHLDSSNLEFFKFWF
jgi:hypothetical protein